MFYFDPLFFKRLDLFKEEDPILRFHFRYRVSFFVSLFLPN